MQFYSILEKVKLYRKQILSFSILILLVIVSFLTYTFYTATVFKVVAWNFDFNYKKIPFDVGYIDFTLSQDLDKSSVNKENFEINPKIDWEVSLVSSNTIRYKFQDKLIIWDDISITLKQDIKSKKWKKLDSDYNYIISVIESPKVLKITPEWKLDNLSQNIAVFFNIPMVALTTLDEKDKLPCPISIEPKIDWVCKWTTSSVLEFIPKDGFLWATKYKINVDNKDWLLYKLSTWSIVEVTTPKLRYFIDEKFSANEGIKIRFNFAADIESLKNNLTLKELDSKKDFYLSYDWANESIILVNLNWWKYKFDKTYTLNFEKWIKPKYWNIETESKETKTLSSFPFLNQVGVYQNIFSWTTIIDTKDFSSSYSYTYSSLSTPTNNTDESINQWFSTIIIPSKNTFFKLSFEEEINVLDKNLFSFENEKWNKIDFDLSYVKEEDYETKKVTENKKLIKLTLKQNLESDTKYKLIIKKDINLNLDDNLVREFSTSKKLQVVDYKFISYSKSCLYLNNKVENVWTKSSEFISTFPESKVSSISDYEYISYEDQVSMGILNTYYSKETYVWNKIVSDDKYIEKWYCPQAKDWSTLYIINTRLNPNSEYKINVKNTLEDEFGNSLSSPFEKSIKTWDIQEKDKYLYISLSKEINLIPTNLPLIVNLQTINLDNIDIDVCEMDKDWYIDYIQNRWSNYFSPKCIKNYNKNLLVKNNYWNLTNNKFDIENDIIWWKTNANYLLVRWNAWWRNQFSNVFIRSDLNLTLESAKNKKLLFATDFKWNQVKDLKLEFIKINYDATTGRSTNSIVNPKYNLNQTTWVYEIEWENSDYSYIVASSGKYSWIVDLSYNMFSDYDFKYVWWTPTYDTNYLYLYTERPIYKPGDTVYIKWLLRKFEYNWYKKSTIKEWKLEVLDSNYQVVSTMQVKLDNNSNFNTSFIIPKESPLWEFSFRFTTPNEEYYKNDAHFYIEEYRKPDFKIDLEWIKTDYNLWEKTQIEVLPKYYFWWNLVSTNWQWSLLTQNYFFDAKGYNNYQFWEWYEYFDCVYWGYCSYEDNLSQVKDFVVDSNGKWSFSYTFPQKEEDAEKIYTFNVEVTDKDTKKTVNKSVSTILHTTDSYVWLQTPYWNDKKVWIKWEFIVLDYDANPVVNKDIKVELIKREWKEVKKQWVDWVYYSEYALEEKKEQTINLKTDKNWLASNLLQTKDSWEYMVKAIYTWKNSKSFTSSTIVYVSGDDYTSWYMPNNDTTEIVAEKNQVLVWDKAIYTLKSPINNWKAIILVEKDDWILDYFIHDIKSYGDKITIDVKNTYYPNYYVRAFLIWEQPWNPLPIYKRALIATKVSTEYKKLNVTILTDKKSYKPWEKVWVWVVVNDSKWNPVSWANLSISIVDESLLALVWNPKKNPYVFFYDMKRYLWTLMYSSMINLIEKLEVKDISNWEKWWAWEQIKWWDSKKKRWVFKDTAFWQSDAITWANGKVYIESDLLPDNLTTWVIEVLVNTPIDNKVWVAYETITTSKELIINDNLPNFLWVWDRVILSPVVFNKTWNDGDFEISLEATSLEVKWWNKRKLFIKNGESKTINFEVLVNERKSFKDMNLASSKIDFKVNQICDKQCNDLKTDEIEKTIQIKDSTVRETVATTWKTKENSFDEHINLWDLKEKIWQVSINYSTTLFNNLTDSIDYLNNYPYGCSEQKTSSILPNLYIKKLYDSVWSEFDLTKKYIDYYDNEERIYKKKSLDQVIKEYIVDIRQFQKTDWWFVYWYDISSSYPNYSNFALTSYILKSLSDLWSLWYKQEEKVMLDSVSYLKTRFYKNYIEWCIKSKYDDCKYSESDRLSAIEAIQSYNSNDYEAYKMYKLLDLKNLDTTWILKKSLVVASLLNIKSLSDSEKNQLKNEVNENIKIILNNELVYNPRWAYIWKTNEYSRIQNTSLFLKVVSILWDKEIESSSYIIDNLNRWIISQKKNWSFGSTQDNISVIDAVYTYLVTSKELKDVNFNAKIKLNSELIDEKNYNDKNKLEVSKKYVDLKFLKSKNTLNLWKTWNWNLYYDLSMSYYLTGKDLLSRDEWFAVIKDYYDYNEYKKIDSLKKEEWQQYIKWKISYDSLKYKKSVFEYLNKLTSFKVWQLVVVKNQIITPETRDKVAFEWFIPAWAELVNPNLATSSTAAFSFWNDIFERKEYRQDRFFGYTDKLYSWIYDVSYLVRFTHAWDFYVKPSNVGEFYNAEVFGRSSGEVVNVK